MLHRWHSLSKSSWCKEGRCSLGQKCLLTHLKHLILVSTVPCPCSERSLKWCHSGVYLAPSCPCLLVSAIQQHMVPWEDNHWWHLSSARWRNCCNMGVQYKTAWPALHRVYLQALSYACSASMAKVTQKKCGLLASVREAGTIKGKLGTCSARNKEHRGESQCC